MAISQKYRRTIICDNTEYIWWIAKDEDYCDMETLYIELILWAAVEKGAVEIRWNDLPISVYRVDKEKR
ncbi:MAG: hypothetical protein HFH05_05680 [Lachnospiraceae bacterium]|nr:hypothetical protein [Lachnospiraceae bacterium]MCI9675188.1 hypothetical protein [Lachnospiraceae bacterium]